MALAPDEDDLARAYEEPGPAGNGRAEAVLADGTVLRTLDPDGDGERTVLTRLGEDGEVEWERDEPRLVGRALADLDGDLALAGEVRRGPLEFEAAVVLGEARRTFGGSTFRALTALPDGTLAAGGSGLVVLDRSLETVRAVELDGVYGLASLGDGLAVAQATRPTAGIGSSRLFVLDGWAVELDGELAGLAAVDGGLVATGTRDGLWVVRLGDGGSVEWERELGPGQGRAIAAAGDGVVVAGDVVSDGVRRLRVVRLDAAGEVVWERTHGDGDDAARGIASTGDTTLVVGSAGRAPTRARALCLDESGDVVWDRVL